MITLIVWAIIWNWSKGDATVVEQFTNPQMAIFILICVASDLNIVIGGVRK